MSQTYSHINSPGQAGFVKYPFLMDQINTDYLYMNFYLLFQIK